MDPKKLKTRSPWDETEGERRSIRLLENNAKEELLKVDSERKERRWSACFAPAGVRMAETAIRTSACGNGRNAKKKLHYLYNMYEAEVGKPVPHRFHTFVVDKHDEIVVNAELTLHLLQQLPPCGCGIVRHLHEELVRLDRTRRRYNRLLHPLVASASAADPPPQRPKRSRKE
jgi:hypothetical protein